MESFFLITKKLIGLSPSGFLANIFATTHFVYLIRRVEELVGEDTSGFISLITQQATWTRSSGSQVVGQVASLGQKLQLSGILALGLAFWSRMGDFLSEIANWAESRQILQDTPHLIWICLLRLSHGSLSFFFGHLFSELFRQGFGAMAGGGGKKNNQRALATNSHDQKRNSWKKVNKSWEKKRYFNLTCDWEIPFIVINWFDPIEMV